MERKMGLRLTMTLASILSVVLLMLGIILVAATFVGIPMALGLTLGHGHKDRSEFLAAVDIEAPNPSQTYLGFEDEVFPSCLVTCALLLYVP
jgi:hypothetical protein